MAINMMFFELKDNEKNFFAKNTFEDFDFTFYQENLDENFISNIKEEELENVHVISVCKDSMISKEILDKFKNLRVISIRTSGYDNICVNSCEERNIAVVNIENAGVGSVAQFTMGLIINLVRKILPANNIEKVSENFNDYFLGRDLSKLTIGIIGTGMVGAEVCRLANAFGMKIVVCNLNAKLELMEKYQVEYKSLEELAEIADIISVNVEYTSENYHLCDEEFFAKCKQGVYFINTSKSEVIDYEALYKYIENCKIGGAALDVIPCKDICTNCKDLSNKMEPSYLECLTQTDYINRFKKYDNVIITPRIANLTQDTIDYILRETIYNVKEALKGEKMCRII